MTTSPPASEDLRTLVDLVDGIEICTMTTVRPDGRIHGRPMGTQKIGEDGALWFMTSRSSLKVDELVRDPRVQLAYSDPKHLRYVSVSGYAVVVEDRAKVQELWSPPMQAWFSGPDDSDLVLLRVEPLDAEYWDSPHGKVAALLQIATKAVTPGHGSEGEDPAKHGTLDL